MLKKFFQTPKSWGLFFLRWGLAIVFFPHGAQKVLGWFGGNGYQATFQYFTQTMGIPEGLAYLAIWTEFLGPILLALGFLTRLASLAIGIEMIVAVILVHLPYGFFMNWYGQKEGEGFEFHILAVSMTIALTALGGGKLSIDRGLGGNEYQSGQVSISV